MLGTTRIKNLLKDNHTCGYLDVILMATPAPNFGNFYRSGRRIQRSGKRPQDFEILFTWKIKIQSLKDIFWEWVNIKSQQS